MAVPIEESRIPINRFVDNAMSSRIHNGHPADANQFPHQVALLIATPQGNSVCGGSIISTNWVLTAAHCTYLRNQVTMRFGSINRVQGGISQTTTRIVNHANYNQNTLNNDVAVLHIPSALNPTGAIQVIRLPTSGQAGSTFEGATTTVSGWGGIVTNGAVQNLLRWVNTRIIPNSQCSGIYGTATVVGHVVCTLGLSENNQGVCGGDSGGPLILNESGVNTQVGVVSFAAAPSIGGCAAGHPSGYMRTNHFLTWIFQQTGIPVRN